MKNPFLGTGWSLRSRDLGSLLGAGGTEAFCLARPLANLPLASASAKPHFYSRLGSLFPLRCREGCRSPCCPRFAGLDCDWTTPVGVENLARRGDKVSVAERRRFPVSQSSLFSGAARRSYCPARMWMSRLHCRCCRASRASYLSYMVWLQSHLFVFGITVSRMTL